MGRRGSIRRPRERRKVTEARIVKITMAVFPSISATRGAIMVANLAKKLQIPMAVAAKRAGKIDVWAIYTRLKHDAAPNEALSTRAGNTSGDLAEYPKNKIM